MEEAKDVGSTIFQRFFLIYMLITKFFTCTVKSHFIVAQLNGESRHFKVKRINFNFSHLHCLYTLAKNKIAWSHFFDPLLSIKKMTQYLLIPENIYSFKSAACDL